MWVEKRDTNTRYVVEQLRDKAGIPEAEIGWAGLKDRRALTWQWISVPKAYEAQVAVLNDVPGVRILERTFHTNRLATGHLAGNKFRILVRDPQATEAEARAILDVLARQGVPNYFGPQRFGKMGDNAVRGYRLLQSGKFRKQRWLDKLLTSALQSLLFNEWVKLRMEQGTYGHVLEGDIAVKHVSGGKFQVGDATVEDPRAVALEISATGPLFGRKYHEAQGAARSVEDQVLAAYGLTRETFKPLAGDRRPIRFPLTDCTLEVVPEGYWVSFFLPKGGFATAVLRELMKTEVGAEEE
jgi:tRNA pseudouridine13 synthase